MRIDFTQIETGEDFELLCEDLLQAMGFTIEAKPARGPDLGKDIIAIKTIIDDVGIPDTHRYLVECKHYAKSGRSVLERDVGNPVARMATNNCDRYLLATSTVSSEKLRTQLAGMPNIASKYKAAIWSKSDLTRRLDAHPDVCARHFPSEPEPEPTPAGALAAIVEGLLEVMRFSCQGREQVPDQVELICTSKGALTRPTAVVCKEGTVQKDDVEALLANVQAEGLGGGVLVTHRMITSPARDRATETGDLVRVFTLDEFYRELIDFEPYVQALVAGYDESELATYYVDLGCRMADGGVYKPMDEYVDAWLDDPTRNHISILGDYGTGKTSFCRQYAAELGRRWLADPDRNRIPILITLREYAKTLSLEPLVTDFLVNQYDIQAKYDAFARFNADGKLVLLFDGFDEMAQKVDYQTTVDNFEELARAVEDRSKVVLTCRTPYFRTREEAEELLHARRAGVWEGAEDAPELPEGPAINLSERPNFEIVHLLPFDDEDVQAILQKRAPDEWEEYWLQIQDTYNLPELAQRPVLLDMIVCSFPQLEPGQAINAARLYELYTDLWLTRDWERGRTLITRDDKRVFMQQLALEMHRRGELSIHYSGLSGRVREHFRLEKADEIDYFDSDVRTCAFLNRDPEGNYRFMHRSFGEFFVAQWLAPKLLDATAPEMTINEEIRGFAYGLLEGADWPPEPPEGVVVPEGMVWVPEGPFIIGGTDADWEVPLQVVHLDHGFFIGRTPVTNGEYARFVEATGYVTLAEKEGGWDGKASKFVKGFDWRHPEGPGSSAEDRMDHPVVQVSWDDAAAYAEWAGARLPAEEEWEKAARGIDGRIYPWGDGFDRARCNSGEDDIDSTTPVGRYSPEGDSPCGCADAVGNVWEWTAREWELGGERQVVRGSAFFNTERSVRCAFRDGVYAFFRIRSDGFRLCIVSQQG